MKRLAISIALCLLASPAWAQAMCSQNPDMISDLLSKADNPETIQTQAIDLNGQLHTVYANEDSGDWTVAITSLETGMTCVAVVGKGWRRVEPEPGLSH